MNRANVIGPPRCDLGADPRDERRVARGRRRGPCAGIAGVAGRVHGAPLPAPGRAGCPGPTSVWPPRTIGTGASAAGARQGLAATDRRSVRGAAGPRRSGPPRRASAARRRRAGGRAGRGCRQRRVAELGRQRAERRRAVAVEQRAKHGRRRPRRRGAPRGRCAVPQAALLDQRPHPAAVRSLEPGQPAAPTSGRRRAARRARSRGDRARRRRDAVVTGRVVDVRRTRRPSTAAPAAAARGRAARRCRRQAATRRRSRDRGRRRAPPASAAGRCRTAGPAGRRGRRRRRSRRRPPSSGCSRARPAASSRGGRDERPPVRAGRERDRAGAEHDEPAWPDGSPTNSRSRAPNGRPSGGPGHDPDVAGPPRSERRRRCRSASDTRGPPRPTQLESARARRRLRVQDETATSARAESSEREAGTGQDAFGRTSGSGRTSATRPARSRPAIRALAALPGARLRGVSRLYATAPVGVVDQPEFRNAVGALDVPRGPDPATGAVALLVALKGLERAFGRRERERWGPRELDLDLLVFGRHRIAVERPPEAALDDPATSRPTSSSRTGSPGSGCSSWRRWRISRPRLVPPGWRETVEYGSPPPRGRRRPQMRSGRSRPGTVDAWAVLPAAGQPPS